MADILAKCIRCNHQFKEPNFLVGGPGTSTNITMVGCTTNCPRCGGQANLQDGTFDLVNDTIRLLTDASPEERQIFEEILENSSDFDEIADQVDQKVPRFAPILAAFKSISGNKKLRKSLRWVIGAVGTGLIGAAIQGALTDAPPAVHAPTAPIPTTQQIGEEFDRRLREAGVIVDPVPTHTPTLAPSAKIRGGNVRKIPRNSPCPCESGTKYKKCHGSPARS